MSAAAMNGKDAHAASLARREKLNEELDIPLVSNFFPIERYFDAADKVYRSFAQSVKEESLLDDSYVYGKRYCWFIIEALPTHNYFNSKVHATTKQRHLEQVLNVTELLERIVCAMDRQEIEKQRLAAMKAERERQENERKINDRFQMLQKRYEMSQKQSSFSLSTQPTNGNADVEASAAEKMRKLMMLSSGNGSTNGHSQQPTSPHVSRDPSGGTLKGRSSSRYRLSDSSDEEDDLPPPLLPPNTLSESSKIDAPPSYYQVTSRRKFLGPAADNDSQQVSTNSVSQPSFLNIQKFSHHDDEDGDDNDRRVSGKSLQPSPSKKLHRRPMRQIQNECAQMYATYKSQGKIKVLPLSTYQGRYNSSLNGCTVISALVAANHLKKHGGIQDEDINQIIDRDCGPILREIRSKLGLGGHALIIPSDVHDHLVDKKILKQEHFAGAAGGNILDDEHIGEFIKLLDGPNKAAATLFFREHVVSIVKYPQGPNSALYDLVDSLPNVSTSINGDVASRTRCTSIDALRVLLANYAARKFGDNHCNYVDRNPWDDSLADLDPRVFQGFVWSTKAD